MRWTLYRENHQDLHGTCKNVADALMKASSQSQVSCWQNAGETCDEKGNPEYRFTGFDLTRPKQQSIPRLFIREEE